MLAAEARWVGDALGKLPTEAISPLLNIGSSTADFREQVQPWIERSIFSPLRARAVEVEHLDMREGAGIDLRGDLFDDSFLSGLATRNYRAILCCNLLEHVPDRATISAKVEMLVPVGGYLIVTVPNRFPYHPDPIDTMFRPDIADITRLFTNCRLVQGNVLNCGTGWDYVGRNPISLIAKVSRRIAGLSENGGLKGSTSFAPWLFRQFRQSCVLLKKGIEGD
jgi:hypothetical protein